MQIADLESVFPVVTAAIALMGMVAAGLAVIRARRRIDELEALGDEVVLIAEEGTVVDATRAVEALAEAPRGKRLRAVLSTFLGRDSDPALDALDVLERTGTAFDLLTTDAGGRPFGVAGRPRGGQVRLSLRPVDAQRAGHVGMPGDRAASAGDVGARVFAGLLAEAPVLAWCRDDAGRITWAAGRITTTPVPVEAEAAARAAARRDGSSGGTGRFRLHIKPEGGATSPPIVLEALEIEGTPGTRLGLAIDASGAATAEQALGRFERAMTDTFAHLNVGLAIFDQSQALAMFNPALVQMWQADPARLARRPHLREILDDLRASRRIPEMADFHAWRQNLARLFDDTERAEFDELWHLADGTDLHVLARPHPHGAIAFLFEDVTERLRLEQRFRHAIDLRRATLDRLDEGLAVFGPDGRLQLVNEAFHEIWGTDAETACPSMHANELLPLIRGLTVETEVWERLMGFITSSESRQAWSARLTLGTERILSARFAALPDGATMAVFGDVTDTERIAHALRERNEALEAVEEMRAAVLDQISHRLRTPLNTIFGFGQLLSDSRFGALTDAQRGYAEGMLEAAGHLLATVDEVTELASLDIDPLQELASGPALGDAILRTGQLLEKRATEEGVVLVVTAPEVESEPDCDPARLRQIVFGMTTDAINRCCGGGEIRLGARSGVAGQVEIFTSETPRDACRPCPDEAKAASTAMPYLRRLVALEGGAFELRAVPGGLSAVCTLAGRAPASDVAGAEPAD